MARALLRVYLESLTVTSNGDVPGDKTPSPDDEERNNAVFATLRYPRSGAPSVASKIEADLQDGVERKFDCTDFWKSGLFKEVVDGETVLTIQVIDRDRVSTLDKLVLKVFGAALGAGLGVVTGGISNAVLGAIVNVPIDALLGSYAVDKDTDVAILGEASVPLAIGSIAGTLTLDLVAPADVTKEYLDFKAPGSGQVVRKKKILIKKGTVSGQVTLKLTTEPI